MAATDAPSTAAASPADRADLVRPLVVGARTLPSNLVLAPMAGVSNLPFRLIARQAGAALVFTETVSAKGLVMGGPKTWRLLETSPRETPCAFQLFGSDPDVFHDAVRRLEDEGAVWIDLNVGCPVKKFIRNRAGSALLRDLPRAAAIVRAMRRGFSGTLSVKMRTGWDEASINAPEFARIAAAEGAELLTVHGRTRQQQYRGRANREHIRRVVDAVPGTPVLANGDVETPEDAFAMLRETGAAGVMIGRGAMGNPWIFGQILEAARGVAPKAPSGAERRDTIERHIELMSTAFPEPRVLASNLKKYVAAYSKGLRGSAAFRSEALESNDLDHLLRLTRDYFGGLAEDRDRAA
ncbi:MAG: tRNA dihydrouridine synthase DusB [Myxococcota bacterium]